MNNKRLMDEGIRLQKVLAEAGLGSRREIEGWIAEGMVTVNGDIAILGQKVTPGSDRICVEGKVVQLAKPKRIVLAMNKPRNVVCSNAAYPDEKTVFDLLPQPYRQTRLFSIGRLDKDSEGLLLLTNDGALAHRLAHPSSGIIKRYHVLLNRAFDPAHIHTLLEGVFDEGERLQALAVIPATQGPKHEQRVEVHLGQGRKREIRRMFQALGYFVKRLKRVQIGKLTLRKIPLGGVQPLSDKEVEKLF